MKLRFVVVLVMAIGLAQLAPLRTAAQEKTMHHVSGTFEVKVVPLAQAPDGLSRMSIDKTIHGGLEATTKGEMIAGGDFKTGSAGYVAMEVVTGTLDGKAGAFALQHTATMDGDGQHMTIIVTPGSGTGELKGLTGSFTIVVKDGKHSYTFDYTLP